LRRSILVLLEAFKRDGHSEIEVRSAESGPMAVREHNIVSLVADAEPAGCTLPWFRRDDIGGIVDFIAAQRG
jgi:hypothetical protein